MLCPLCGRDFKDLHARNTHIGIAHKEEAPKYLLSKKEKWKRYSSQYKRYYYENRERILRVQKERIKRYKKRKEIMIEKLGGKCYVCSRTDSLTFHHKNREESPYHQKPHQGSGWIKTIRQVEKEPEKFFLLCRGCHRVVTFYTRNDRQRERLIEVLRSS